GGFSSIMARPLLPTRVRENMAKPPNDPRFTNSEQEPYLCPSGRFMSQMTVIIARFLREPPCPENPRSMIPLPAPTSDRVCRTPFCLHTHQRGAQSHTCRQPLDFRQSAAASTKLQQGPRRDEKNQIPAMIALLMLGLDVRGA